MSAGNLKIIVKKNYPGAFLLVDGNCNVFLDDDLEVAAVVGVDEDTLQLALAVLKRTDKSYLYGSL